VTECFKVKGTSENDQIKEADWIEKVQEMKNFEKFGEILEKYLVIQNNSKGIYSVKIADEGEN
jgi:hypothetical protein